MTEFNKFESGVTYETRILTELGYLPIGDLEGEYSGLVLTEYGYRPYLGIQNLGVQKVLKVVTGVNKEIKVAPSHCFRIMGEDGNTYWKYAHDLVVGDYLLCQRGNRGMIPEDRGESPDLWEALGLLWGDGSQTNKGSQHVWVVPEGEEETLEWLKAWLESQGYRELKGRVIPEGQEHNCCGASWTRIPYVEERLYRVSIADPQINRVPNCTKKMYSLTTVHPDIKKLLPEYERRGEWRSNGFPSDFWVSGKKQMGTFLRGLFTTDGTVGDGDPTHRFVCFSSVHRKVAEDVNRALFLLGVTSQIYTWVIKNKFSRNESTICHTVRLVGLKSAQNFLKNVGFCLSRKQDRLLVCCKEYDKGQSAKYGYPHSTELIKRLFPKGVCSRIHKEDGSIVSDSVAASIRVLKSEKRKNHLLSDAMIGKVLDKARIHGEDQDAEVLLQEYVDNDWFFDKVGIVKQLESEPVFSLVGCESSSYITEGLVSCV